MNFEELRTNRQWFLQLSQGLEPGEGADGQRGEVVHAQISEYGPKNTTTTKTTRRGVCVSETARGSSSTKTHSLCKYSCNKWYYISWSTVALCLSVSAYPLSSRPAVSVLLNIGLGVGSSDDVSGVAFKEGRYLWNVWDFWKAVWGKNPPKKKGKLQHHKSWVFHLKLSSMAEGMVKTWSLYFLWH